MSQLIDLERMIWRKDLIHKYFWPYDAEQILAIKLPLSRTEDFIAWQHEKSGVYSVKSAYKLAKDIQGEEAGTRQMSSGHQHGSPAWKAFWKIPLPHKVLIFGWKVANKGLATQDNKKRRGIEISSICKICGMEEESSMHALVRCYHARSLREAIREEWPLPTESFFLSLTPESLIVSTVSQDVDMGARVLLLLWRTWQVRNNITHEKEKLSFAKSVGFLTKYWTELCSLRQSHRPFDSKGKSLVCNSLAAGRREVKVQGELKWERPAEGWCKVNVDGAFDPTTGKGGIGFIIRDRAGSVLLSAWKYLQLAAEWYRGRVILESDCSYVVGLLREGNFRRSRLKFALEETGGGGENATRVDLRPYKKRA